MQLDTVSTIGDPFANAEANACRIDPVQRPGTRPAIHITSAPPTLEAFIDSLSARDFERLAACLGPEARLRALVPAGAGQSLGRAAVVGQFAGWFGDATRFDLFERRIAAATDRWLMSYRIDLDEAGGRYAIDQHLFCDLRDEAIDRIDLLCSGFRRVRISDDDDVHHYDAGTLGCADGLADAFRARLAQVPVGESLVVIARDPAAREDLPSLARLLGNRVLSVTTKDDGHLEMTVERAR